MLGLSDPQFQQSVDGPRRASAKLGKAVRELRKCRLRTVGRIKVP